MEIRAERPEDISGIFEVNEAAFGRPDEALLVDRLRARKAIVLSLVAVEDGKVVGHVLFSPVLVHNNSGVVHVLTGLGPVAVLPARQNQGIGSLLIKSGIKSCRAAGYRALIVLGHPNYYPRFGFRPAGPQAISCAYDVPEEAFMVLELEAGALEQIGGVAHYHPEFDGV